MENQHIGYFIQRASMRKPSFSPPHTIDETNKARRSTPKLPPGSISRRLDGAKTKAIDAGKNKSSFFKTGRWSPTKEIALTTFLSTFLAYPC